MFILNIFVYDYSYILGLLHVSAIRNWTLSIDGELGFLQEVMACLQQLPEDEKNYSLVIDAK